MQLTTEQESEVKTWMVRKLADISDADPDILTEYCLAILKSNSSDSEVRKSAIENLEDFLKDHTVSFVDEIFTRYARKSPLPTAPAILNKSADVITGVEYSSAIPIQAYEPAPPTQQKDSARLNPGRKRSHQNANNNGHNAQYRPGMVTEPLRSRRTPKVARMMNRPGLLQAPFPSNAMAYPLPPLPTPPLGFPAFDPANPMAAYAFMQTMFPQMAALLPPSPDNPGPVFDNRMRCQDYDNQGYCILGSSCPFEHGNDRIIAPQSDEYDPTKANFNMNESDGRALGLSKIGARTQRGTTRRGVMKAVQNHRPTFSDPRPPANRESTTIVVERIPSGCLKEHKVREFFSQYGNILDINLIPSKHLAIVKFDEHAAAKRAWGSPKVVFDNRFVKVYWYKPTSETSGATNGHTTMARDGGAVSNADFVDEATFQQQQKEKQKAYEERMRIRKAMGDARRDIVSRREHMIREREGLMKKLAAAEGQNIVESGIRTTLDGSDGNSADVPDPKIKSLRDQLAQLQAEAKTLGIDPDASSENIGVTSSSYHWKSGPPVPARKFPYHGHGFPGHRHYGHGFVRGRDSSVKKLDNRPRNITISGVDFDGAKEESLRSYLTLIGPFEKVDLNSEREDSRIVVFKERWQAEQVMHGRRDIPGVGKVELSWSAGNPANGRVVDRALGTEEDLNDEELQESGTNILENDSDQQQQEQQQQQQQQMQDVDLDVAGGDDDDWGQTT